MNREDRAKQFMAFDALAGLREELKKREEKFLKIDKKDISEERALELSDKLCTIRKGEEAKITFYYKGVYVSVCGVVIAVNTAFKYITIDQTKISFSDIYEINLTQNV